MAAEREKLTKVGKLPSGAMRFLARVKRFQADGSARHIREFCRGFDEMLLGARQLAQDALRTERSSAPRSNLLLLLGMQLEEWVHTEILRDLLDPAGTHGQGTLFLEAFLANLLRRPDLLAAVKANPEKVWIDSEIATHLGRPDLLIRVAPHFVAIVENKVRAKEGKDQLVRYRRFLDQQSESKKLLIYLTPDGRESETGVKRYVRLSYARDVRSWLRDAGNRAKAPAVRIFLGEYLTAIGSFSN